MEILTRPILITALIAVSAVYPPIIGFLSIFLMAQDTAGIGQLALVPEAYVSFAYLVAVIRMAYDILARKRFMPPRLRTLALIGSSIAAWIWLSSLAGGSGFYGAFYASFQGALGVVFVAAYSRDRLARALFVAALVIQLVVALVMVGFPGTLVDLVRPRAHRIEELGDLWRFETPAAKETAQFDNSVQLAFHGGIGLVLGVYLALHQKWIVTRLSGAALIAAGGTVSLVTTQRGVWLGTLCGVVALMLPLFAGPVRKAWFTIAVPATITGLTLWAASSDNPVVALRARHFMAVREDTYRVPAAIRSLDVLLDNPLFGTNGNCQQIVDRAGGAPHLSFYFLATMYGLPAGVGMLLLTLISLASPRRSTISRDMPIAPDLARAVALTVAGMALTNNMSAGLFGWLCLGVACLPWALECGASAPLSDHKAVLKHRTPNPGVSS